MDATFKTLVWGQLGAAIDMLENAMRACPDSLWVANPANCCVAHELGLCLLDLDAAGLGPNSRKQHRRRPSLASRSDAQPWLRPPAAMGDRSRQPEFWYVSYHTLFFLDYYLSERAEGFTPPPPFTLAELDPEGVLPERVYRKDELLAYLEHGRAKLRGILARLTDATAGRRCEFERPALTVGELLLNTMRHVQHHAAQLNLMLRQTIDAAPRWVTTTSARPV